MSNNRNHPRYVNEMESADHVEVTGLPDGNTALDVGLRIPGHGLPPRPEDSMMALQPFARLTRGQALGKKEILAYNTDAGGVQSSMTTILTVGGREGSDLDACNMCVTLSQPRVIKAPFGSHGGIGNFNQQNASGSYDNAEAGTGDFPGTSSPIAWVPITAIIEWGLGGTRHRAFVDFMQGVAINLTASWVRVHAAVAPDAANLNPDEEPGNTSALYEVAANVGPGWTRPGNAQRTVFLGAIPGAAPDEPGESAVFAVPPFVKRATVISMDPTANTGGITPPALTAAYLRFWQGPTGSAVGQNVGNYFQSGNQPIAFDVPNGAAYFSVQSAMTGEIPFAVIFDLEI